MHVSPWAFFRFTCNLKELAVQGEKDMPVDTFFNLPTWLGVFFSKYVPAERRKTVLLNKHLPCFYLLCCNGLFLFSRKARGDLWSCARGIESGGEKCHPRSSMQMTGWFSLENALRESYSPPSPSSSDDMSKSFHSWPNLIRHGSPMTAFQCRKTERTCTCKVRATRRKEVKERKKTKQGDTVTSLQISQDWWQEMKVWKWLLKRHLI